MNIEKLLLAERIRRHENGQPAYPEYIPGIIRNLGEMPVADYLAGLDQKQQQRFWELIGCSSHADHTYQWAAMRVCRLYKTRPELAAEAMRILAAPMIRYDDYFNEKKVPPRV